MNFEIFDVFVIFVIFVACVLVIPIVGLIRYKVTGFIDKLIKKSLYSQNTKTWYKLSKVKFNTNRLLPMPSCRFLMGLFLCGVICYALVRNTYGSRTLSSWQDLNGRWAVPGYTYGQSIMSMFREMLSK